MRVSELNVLLFLNVIAVIILIATLSLSVDNIGFYILTVSVVLGEIVTLISMLFNKKQ